jgi:hypothetical protein
MGHAVENLVETLVPLELFIDMILPAANVNEYQKYFLGVKAAGA